MASNKPVKKPGQTGGGQPGQITQTPLTTTLGGQAPIPIQKSMQPSSLVAGEQTAVAGNQG